MTARPIASERRSRGIAVWLAAATVVSVLACAKPDEALPGFTPRRLDWYHTDVRAWAKVTSRSALSAVIGDFNGDSILDLVADGTDGPREVGFHTLGRPGTYPAIFEDEADAKPLVLAHEGWQEVAFEKASVLYYIRDGKIMERITSDRSSRPCARSHLRRFACTSTSRT